jgi:hypothetical protein
LPAVDELERTLLVTIGRRHQEGIAAGSESHFGYELRVFAEPLDKSFLIATALSTPGWRGSL